MIQYRVLPDLLGVQYFKLVDLVDAQREAEAEGKAAGAYHLYTATRELFIFMGFSSFPLLLPHRVLPELEERTKRGRVRIVEQTREGNGSVTAFSRLLLLPEIPSVPGREAPCPLNGVTGLLWLRGTPWNRRHRRAQRKAHLFWKNIIRTRARHEPHQGRCSPALASLSVHLRAHPLLRTARVHNWSAGVFFEEMTARCGKVTLREVRIAGRVRPMRKAAREVRNHEFPPRMESSCDFREGNRFGLLSRVRREADIRFLRFLLLP